MLGIERAREIGRTAVFRQYAKREVAPGILNKADLERFIRNGLLRFWHPCGTAKMGRDAMSIVAVRLKVNWRRRSPRRRRFHPASSDDAWLSESERAAAILQGHHNV